MSLDAYRERRDFERTREPRGRAHEGEGFSFVVQKHAARHLHYDLRLELGGVLLSWAVPKGPSLDPSIKRLAMHVEDHPIEYGAFEGTIPRGEYGGGAVMIWDKGTWEPEGDARSAYAKGRLTFTLHGEKLRGTWHLVRTGNEQRWLLFKGRDDEANAERSVTDELPRSAESGRTIEEIETESESVWRSDRDARATSPIEPELATLVPAPPEGDDWLHEIKLDGYRVLARVERRRATLFTRNQNDWTDRFASLAREIARLPVKSATLDGEVVAQDPRGVSDFQLLQRFMSDRSEDRLIYFVFDLLELDGRDLRSEPLEARKRALAEIAPGAPRVRVCEHVIGSGARVFEEARKLGLEGVVSKRRASPYRSGRGRDWLKSKCLGRQELVIGGFTDPTGARAGFGALLLGAHKGGALAYVGKVGTGFSQRTLASLEARLAPLARATSPFVNPPKGAEGRRAHWVEPTLVCEIDFREMTKDGVVRQAVFRGLRADKSEREVTLEIPADIEPKARAAPKLTHADKVLYPASKITKGDLYAYYERVAERMLPHVAGRPLMFVRCPDGLSKCFFQKHWRAGMPKELRRVDLGDAAYTTIDDVNGLFALAQLGALEIHTWGTHVEHFERPDLLVFDLDPDEAVPFSKVIAAARELRAELERAKLRPWVKTTGGKGLHVCVPIEPTLEWRDAKEATRLVAESLRRARPDLYVTTMTKARRKGKIFIDYFRNGRGATFIAPYSTRAREGAPVAAPIAWEDLSARLKAERYRATSASRLLERPDPWRDMLAPLGPRIASARTQR